MCVCVCVSPSQLGGNSVLLYDRSLCATRTVVGNIPHNAHCRSFHCNSYELCSPQLAKAGAAFTTVQAKKEKRSALLGLG